MLKTARWAGTRFHNPESLKGVFIRKCRRETISFQFGNEEFFALARKLRDGAEAYRGTPRKKSKRLTQPGRKGTVYGWKLKEVYYAYQPGTVRDTGLPQMQRGYLPK
jgi:hypothetical protein